MQVKMEMEISLLKIILHYKIFIYKRYFFINKGLGSPSISNFFYTSFYYKIYISGLIFLGFLTALTRFPA